MGQCKNLWIDQHENLQCEYVGHEITRAEFVSGLSDLGFQPEDATEEADNLQLERDTNE